MLFFVLLSLCVVVKCALTALLRIVLFSAAFAADAVVQLLFVLLLLFVCQIDFCCPCYFCVSFWMWARLRACGRACLCVCAQGKAGPRACARGVRMCGGRFHPVRVRAHAVQARAVQAQFLRGPAPGLGSLPWGRLLRDSSQHAETSLETTLRALRERVAISRQLTSSTSFANIDDAQPGFGVLHGAPARAARSRLFCDAWAT